MLISTSLAAGVSWNGRVADENGKPVEAAHIVVRPAGTPSGSWQTESDPTGVFTLELPEPGNYIVNVERQGYYALHDYHVRVEANEKVTLIINTVREVFQSVNVNERPSPVEVTNTENTVRLTGTEVNDVPYRNSHSLRESMTLMPGVLEDPSGALHFNGSSENQVLYVLNGFNITDPITGKFSTLLAVEGIRNLEYSSGRESPQSGKGSAGALNISTETGTDTFHSTATDFIPGFSIQQGVRLGNWYPRLGVSGPIVRGRAWFSDTFSSEYSQSLITGLPKGENTRSGWAGGNLLHTQVNLAPASILFADFLVNVNNQGQVGLGPLDPVSTTSDFQMREYFASVKDQLYLGHGALIEFGYGFNHFRDTQSPQGQSLYIFSPEGRSGNYFVDSNEMASRHEIMAHGYLPAFHFFGTHRLEAGVDTDLLRYQGNFHRTGYELIGLSGAILSQTLFQGAAAFPLRDTEAAEYVLDNWSLAGNFQINLGFREDWDQRIGESAWSPRIAFSWSPFHSSHTRISGGYSITRDAPTLAMLGREYDQSALTTVYNPDGTPMGAPALTQFAPPAAPLQLPRASNWSVGADHEITAHLRASVSYLRRRGTNEFAFLNTLEPDAPASALPLPNAALPGTYELSNSRRDDYDAVQMSARQTFSGQYEWMASYTHSRALSNAVLINNAAEPLQVLPELVPMPWDAPNRFLGWAYLPLPWKHWAVAGLADARTGFPFSTEDETGIIQGTVASHRFPFNFDLNIAIERMITLRGYRFALRGGIDNATGHKNPTAVNNVVGAPNYLQFLGSEGRHFVLRIRFFGRASGK